MSHQCPGCGKLIRRSKLCMGCNAIARREQPLKSVLPKANSLNYFPEGRRFGLLAVSGYGGPGAATTKYGTTFSILDGHRCWEEIEHVTVRGQRAALVRLDLMKRVKHLNKLEREALQREERDGA